MGSLVSWIQWKENQEKPLLPAGKCAGLSRVGSVCRRWVIPSSLGAVREGAPAGAAGRFEAASDLRLLRNPASCLQFVSSLCHCFLSARKAWEFLVPLAEVLQDRLCGVRIMDTCWAYREEEEFYNGAFQNCLDPCKRQLCTDPVTTSPPPSLSPEPLGFGKGRDNPPSPRVSWGFPNGMSWQKHWWDRCSLLGKHCPSVREERVGSPQTCRSNCTSLYWF